MTTLTDYNRHREKEKGKGVTKNVRERIYGKGQRRRVSK